MLFIGNTILLRCHLDKLVTCLLKSFHLLWEFADASSLQSLAFKGIMTMPALLSQTTSGSCNNKLCSQHLLHRLNLWHKGDLLSLPQDGIAIQHHLSSYHKKSVDSLPRSFSNHIMEGHVKSALQLLSAENTGGVLPLDTDSDGASVRSILLKKHPPAQSVHPPSVISKSSSTLPPFHPIVFDNINGSLIRSIVLQLDGAAGPSGLDLSAWKRLCTYFHSDSNELCNALAVASRQLCLGLVDPASLTALLACRLIALDKKPGVWLIEISDVRSMSYHC